MRISIVYKVFCDTVERAYHHLSKHELLSAEKDIQTACDMTFESPTLSIYRSQMHDIDRALMLGEYASAHRMVIEFMEKLGI